MHAIHSLRLRSALRLVNVVALPLIGLGIVGGQAQAETVLQVSPVRLQFEPQQHAQALQVANHGTQALDAQVRVFRWTQENGQDVLAPIDDIVVSPAILKVVPGQQQTVRIIRVKPITSAAELSYRVLVDELPNKSAPTQRAGLKVLMRYSIPLFIAHQPAQASTKRQRSAPPAASLTDLSAVSAQLVPSPSGKHQLSVRNDGATHLRITNLSVASANGGVQPLGSGLTGYVLPGQQMSWPLPNIDRPLRADQTLKARFNDDRQAQELPLVKPER